MMELPEARVIADQMDRSLRGKTIRRVTANHTPHKFAWFYGDPEQYDGLLTGQTVTGAAAHGGFAALWAGDRRILFQEGARCRLLQPGEPPPQKHQLLVDFTDGVALVATVQMYGGMLAYRTGEPQNDYVNGAMEKPSPLEEAFDWTYFDSLCRCERFDKLSAKAFLATEQRIPGLGNGVLQDLLWRARIAPKRKMGTLSGGELEGLYRAVKEGLADMARQGGRDTERDLFGQPGGYMTVLSRLRVDKPCPRCGGVLTRETYLGGSVIYCPCCQPAQVISV